MRLHGNNLTLLQTGCFLAVIKEPLDYVVGSGTAELAVANRLSEILDVCVAVIESGGDERSNSIVTIALSYGAAY